MANVFYGVALFAGEFLFWVVGAVGVCLGEGGVLEDVYLPNWQATASYFLHGLD